MHEHDRIIINQLQGGFPICENPWGELEKTLDIPADEIITRVERMKSEGLLSRFGPMYHAEKMGGGLTLAAMKVNKQRYDEVTEIVNSFAEVAHNYEREHELSMWFVIATETPEQIQQVIEKIEQKTGIRVYNMPKKQEFFLNLKFEI
ncbi:MAG: AsnC family protein [endosymbiont of Galathealinum brachiosum]|uniref:siroheme decarboxylase n=1 Tax=endosymbiont of Galathealinum brachiosum TaxID=2200906 RepID=A0A370DLG5_9GAMM|nr:MAG: AsnC family protein [endosymbiont of Galathealinum brachiosum]